MMPRIRPVQGSQHLVCMRRGLWVRYGYRVGLRTLWGAYRRTRVKAMAELADAMWSLISDE